LNNNTTKMCSFIATR